MPENQEQHDRETAALISATFYAGRDGIGPVKLFETAELIRGYIEHGDLKLLKAAARSPRR